MTLLADMQPSLSSYGTLTGQLFLYGAGRACFESPAVPTSSRKKCILLGGLSDGLLPTPYTAELDDICHQHDWSLVQPILSSSYTGFGHGTLDRDVEELQELMHYLCSHRQAQDFCLIGHSTGCQDAIHLLQHANEDILQHLKVVVLQAPVSDREHLQQEEGYTQHLEYAQTLQHEGKGDELMPRQAFWAPITVQRYLDLAERGGTDDYFSSDYSKDELIARLGHVGRLGHLQCLVAFSGADEYVPDHVDKVELANRLVAAMNTHCDDQPVAQALYLPTANHNLSQGPDDKKLFLDKVAELLHNVE